MSNKIIYPILIIIFSILIIFAIFNKKNNEKLNKGIERFNNEYLYKNKNKLIKNMENNQITKDFANGTWTNPLTTINSNNEVSDLTTINIIDTINGKNINFGNINLMNQDFKITYVLNENIVAVSKTVPSFNIHIKFMNIFNDEKNVKINKGYNVPQTLNCVVSFFIMNLLIFKFVSYKVYNNKVSPDLYQIIKLKDIFINEPKPVYDFETYHILVGNYLFPNDYISYSFNGTDPQILETINSKYHGRIKYSIKRVFESPTGNEIITKNSTPILLNSVDNGRIPENIIIKPFLDDKQTNNLLSFFKPKATLLYFYKLIRTDLSYNFKDETLIKVPSSTLNLKNKSDKMYNNIIQHNNLNTVQEKDLNYYRITYVTKVNSDLESNTVIPFSLLYNLL